MPNPTPAPMTPARLDAIQACIIAYRRAMPDNVTAQGFAIMGAAFAADAEALVAEVRRLRGGAMSATTGSRGGGV